MSRILIIDDEAFCRMILRKILEGAGYHVEEAVNGKDAERIYRDSIIDLIITDIVMPEKEGLETIRDIKQNYPGMKIIAISGAETICSSDYLEMASLFGASSALWKPVDAKSLLAAVGKCLASSPP